MRSDRAEKDGARSATRLRARCNRKATCCGGTEETRSRPARIDVRRRHGLRLAALANDFDDAARRGLHDDDLVIHDNKVSRTWPIRQRRWRFSRILIA